MDSTCPTETQQDRVRNYAPPSSIARVDQETRECLANLADADPGAMTRHIEQLARERDMERYLQTNASLLTLAGIVLGATKSRKWLVIPAIVLPFLLQHAVQGWCPPVPIFRKLGIRTRKEINREKYAIKALRGDFTPLSDSAIESPE